MSTTLERPASFGRSSHVRTYWLLHSEGFHVRGRRLRGTVEAVHGLPSQAEALVVRRRLFGRRLVLPVDAVERVVPAQELLVVEDGAQAGRNRLRGGARTGLRLALRGAAGGRQRAGALARGTARSVVAGARFTGHTAQATWRSVVPPARRAGAALAALVVSLAALSMLVVRAGAAGAARAARHWLGWLRSQGPELTEELLRRLGQTVGPLEGPQRHL